MSSALWIGTTGLSASNKQLDVIGNNLANANTIGFKCSDASFASMLSQSLSGGTSMQVGQGVGVAAVTTQFAQGSFQSTGNATDVAIDGTGFFIVKNPKEDLTYYTRAGSFYINKDGDLADTSGYLVQGHMIDSSGKESASMTNINLTGRKSKPQETTEFRLGLNLNVETEPTDATNYFTASQSIYDSTGQKHSLTVRFDRAVETQRLWYLSAQIDDGDSVIPEKGCWMEFDDEGALVTDKTRQILAGDVVYTTAAHDTAVTKDTLFGTLYDKDGAAYNLSTGKTIVYSGTDHDGNAVAEQTFTIAAGNTIADLLDDIETNFGGSDKVEANLVGGRIVLIDRVTGKSSLDLVFDGVKSTAEVAVFGTPSFTNPLGQVGNEDLEKADIDFDFSSQNESWGKDGIITWDLTSDKAPEITSYALDSRVTSSSNDGYPAGLLSSIDISANGIIQGFFTNGQQQELARILTASFTNNGGLFKVGSYFTETAESGAPTVGNPSEGGMGKLQSHSLEISNTDVAREFIKMIAAQRAYQSNSRIITAADEMLQELMNIKR